MKLERVIAYAIVLCVFGLVSLGGWYFARKINYALQYKAMVRATVTEMVRGACLK